MRSLVGCTLIFLSILVVLSPVVLRGQGVGSPQSTAATDPQKEGVATGGVHAPVLDPTRRPITESGLVKTGPVVFEDVSAKAGISSWHHTMGSSKIQFIRESPGSGVALLDYDGDGWLDIYLVNGSTYEAVFDMTAPPHAALFHNNHDGTFTDVTAKAGIGNDRWGFGVAVGDYDNDGWPDLYVTNFGKNRLYHNNHDGTFTDLAEKAGVQLGGWSSGPSFGDYDGDGKLDLFIPGYVHYEPDQEPRPGANPVNPNSCQFRGVNVFCGPRGLKGEPDHLFHNNGDGTFTDVSVKAGVADPHGYYGFTGLFADLNNDGRPDLVVADDSTPNYLYINKGDGTFQEESAQSGYAVNESGRTTASMGIAVGDYRNNGWLDLFHTTFSDDYDVLYRNDGDANFTDASYQAGLAEPTVPFLGWGDGFVDYDNDGWKDLFIANGHVYPVVDQNHWGTSFAQRPLLFHNREGKNFELVAAVEGTGLAAIIPARGAAFGDLFNDGKIDVVINNLNKAPTLLRNVNPDHHHWVELSLVGGPKSTRDAIGATVYLTAGGLKQRGDVLSGGSFASSNDLRVHFGLGEAEKIDAVEIHWPSGVVEKVSIPGVDKIFTVEEGKHLSGANCLNCAPKMN